MEGSRVDLLGIVPTPEVAFLARRWKRFGLSVTPSHNAVGYVGLKGFGPTGRLFDREWRTVAEAYRCSPSRSPGSPARSGPVSSGSPVRRPTGPTGTGFEGQYIAHLTRDLASGVSVVVDTRGGATARAAPKALRRLGARVVEVTSGFSPDFFGGSPEPRPESLSALSARVVASGSDLGCTFDGDGDRCVFVDERGQPVEPEVIGLLLHRTIADPRSPVVASVDVSRALEGHVRTVRSRVGGRFVTKAMRRAGAEVALERSGHYYVRRYGGDSDGVLVACLVAHALGLGGDRLSTLSRQFGRLHRGTLTVDFPRAADARLAFRALRRRLGDRAAPGLDGVTVELPEGWCLIRPSNTQPSIRFSYESPSSSALRSLERTVRGWGGSLSPSTTA